MGEITQEIFDDFVNRFSVYLANANESKKRGNNDYNPLKAVQNLYDEVNMHSGFLHSLLDTNGEHYQDDLFLRLFLETLKLKDCGNDKNLSQWFGDTKNAQVEKEYYIIDKELDEKGFIDLYISNGEKHIILENKVDSGDGDKQIAKYIGGLRDKGVEYENIAVVYLTKKGDELSKQSRQDWNIEDNFLKCNEYKLPYKKISYEINILEWIKECQKEVGNITSLNSALEFYKDIIEIITGQKESKMSIVDFFKESKDFGIAFEILNDTGKYCDKAEIIKNLKANGEQIKQKYFSTLQIELDRQNLIDWKILVGDECKKFHSENKPKTSKNLVIYNENYENQTFRYIFECEIATSKHFGARLNIKKDDGHLNFLGYSFDEANQFKQPLISKFGNYIKLEESIWWFKGRIRLDFSNITKIKQYFLDNYEKVIKINEWLKEQENTPNSNIYKLAQEVKNYKL